MRLALLPARSATGNQPCILWLASLICGLSSVLMYAPAALGVQVAPASNASKSDIAKPIKFVETEPLPVTRIIMFNSGLSQLVHEGTVSGNCRINMRFSEHDVDDVLKSLVFEDEAGGTIKSVEYNPAPDIADVAADKLGPALTLAQTLQKYRGERVNVQTEDQNYSGSILSVENRQKEEAFIETLTIVNENGFVSIPINDFESISFDNEKLREEFQLAMQGLQKSRKANAKEISLLFEGDGERKVRYSYNVDSPIWRMTYRLDLKKDQSILQGWAHIDNVTGVDWKEIQLDLRSGRPQSFHAEVFSPVLAERDSVALSVFDIPAGKMLTTKFSGRLSGLDDGFGYDMSGGDFSGGMGGFGGGGMGGLGGGGMGGLGGFDGGGFGGGPPQENRDISSSFQSRSSTGRSNQMVQFKLTEPVTLGAGRSAMVPVIKVELPAKRYSKFHNNEKAFKAAKRNVTTRSVLGSATLVAELTNSSETILIPGPVSIYQSGDFMGDAALDRVEIGSKQELRYGDDQAVELVIRTEPLSSRVAKVSMSRSGKVEIESIQTLTSRCEFRNNDSLQRKFLLETEFEFDNVQPKPELLANGRKAYEVDAEPNSVNDLKVVQQKTIVSATSVSTIVMNQIEKWKSDKTIIDPVVLTRMERFEQARSIVETISSESSQIRRDISGVEQEQTRLLNFVKALQKDSSLQKSYLTKLEATEKRLETLRESLASTLARLKQAQADWAEVRKWKPDQ